MIELSLLDVEGGPGPAGDLKAGAEAGNFPNELSAAAACPRVHNLTSEQTRHEEAVALPPIDGGAKAWTFVFCSVILDSLVWGFPFRCVVLQSLPLAPPAGGPRTTPPTHVTILSYGVFQEWYLSHPPFENASEASINAIGTVTLAIQYSEGLLLQFVAQRRPQWLRPIMLGALVTCIASLFLSSFATKVGRSAASMSRELKSSLSRYGTSSCFKELSMESPADVCTCRS